MAWEELDPLYRLDVRMLKALNSQLADPALDHFWRFVTDLHKQPWFYPVLVPLLVLWMVYIYRAETWKPVLMVALAIGLADGICYRVFKLYFKRPRPFQNPELSDWLRHVGDAGGYSFPSNHAANVFAAALVLGWYFPRGRYFFYILATVVALSRVVLGVHYPFDVYAGALLGVFVGFLIRALLLNQFRSLRPRPRVSREDGAIRFREMK